MEFYVFFSEKGQLIHFTTVGDILWYSLISLLLFECHSTLNGNTPHSFLATRKDFPATNIRTSWHSESTQSKAINPTLLHADPNRRPQSADVFVEIPECSVLILSTLLLTMKL